MTSIPMKKILPIILMTVAVIGLIFVLKRKPTEPEPVKEEKKPTVQEFNTLAVKDRPYVALVPSASGGEVFLSVDRSGDALLEYEIEYQAVNQEGGTLLQGGGGRLELASLTQPTKPKEFCFCSESKGKKKYDTGVTGGTLTLRFSGGDKGDYSLKGNFTIGNIKDKEGVLASSDSKATLTMGDKEKIADTAVVVVSETFGLPDTIEGEILEGPYGFFTADGVNTALTDSTLTFQSKKDLTGAKIMGWDETEQKWLKVDANITQDGENITLAIDRLGVYVLIK